DGIRDRNVTGVQTCALPIWEPPALETPEVPSHTSSPAPGAVSVPLDGHVANQGPGRRNTPRVTSKTPGHATPTRRSRSHCFGRDTVHPAQTRSSSRMEHRTRAAVSAEGRRRI